MPSEAEIYARVIAAKPELQATCPLLRDPSKFHELRFICGGWWSGDDAGVPEPIVLALIESHWMDKLPRHSEMHKGESSKKQPHGAGTIWRIYVPCTTDEHPTWHPTRFHALAEFHVPGSTKGGE